MTPVRAQVQIRESEADFQSWFVDFMRLRGWTLKHNSDSRKEAGGRLVGKGEDAATVHGVRR